MHSSICNLFLVFVASTAGIGLLNKQDTVVWGFALPADPSRPNSDLRGKGDQLPESTPWKYPTVFRNESTKETLHGYQIADPYRWLEDPNSANTKSFVEAQNKVTKDYLSKDKNAKAYKAEFDKFSTYPTADLPEKVNNKYFTFVTAPGKDQPDVYYQESTHSFSPSGDFFAYAISVGGSDMSTIHIRCVEDNALCKAGAQLKDTIEQVKFPSMAWTRDNSGFFYMVEAMPKRTQRKPMLYYHKVGTPQSEDRLMFKSTNSDDKAYMPTITDDGLWLILGIVGGSSEASKMHIAPMTQSKGVPEKLALTKVVDNFDAAYYYIANEGKPSTLVATYNLDAPKRGFVDLIPQHETKIPGNVILLGKDKLAISYLNYSKSDVVIHDLKTGRRERDISSVLPVALVPTIIMSTLPATDTAHKPTYQAGIVLNIKWRKFPLTVVARKDIKLDGSQPALLYGYGGFGINSTPKFDPLWVVFMKHFRGVVAIAGIRGGSEYGETWHQDGMLHKKQNSFDDFQTPELFGCALATVGVMDMLRFHKFTIGNFWIQEYGNPDVKADFDKKVCPAMLLKTGLNDDRVVPAHSYKLAAELQYKLPNNPNPLMLLVDDNSGHGSASNAQVFNEMIADLSFMALSLKLKWYP
ncbi:hypothetical protein BDF22DRAFT_743413 [Syncephalis plumigaleata]|nr:hypothetical protein BDF22DRAFT_743413 [Syncephalis plumigaleata]